jgi:hypothetical protein
MYSACGNAVLPALGFPIRESADHRLFSAYPRLIAAVHALHRLLVPRHPPCALPILTVIIRSARPRARETDGDTRLLAWLCSFQGPQRGARPDWALGLSKLNSMRPRETSSAGARSGRRFGSRSSCAGALCAGRLSDRSNPGGFPRKEVIQPHLPVRLPCYDFTPVTSPTFDGSLPKGLGHRLRVLLASVV